MITIINYGLGNVMAIANIYQRLGIPARIVTSASELADAERIILPGVGAFDWAMTRLNQSGMRERLDELVVGRARPVLGICVGMQMMGARSDEGVLGGLQWIDGEVKKFDETAFTGQDAPTAYGLERRGATADRRPVQRSGLPGAILFLHSYYFVPRRSDDVLADTDYNGQFASSLRHGNVWGVQFHPEKSHGWGIRLLQNFASL